MEQPFTKKGGKKKIHTVNKPKTDSALKEEYKTPLTKS